MVIEVLDFFAVNNFQTRPNANDGVWVLFLLPVSLIISTLKHPIVSTPTYKLSSLLSVGLILISTVISFQRHKNQRLKILNTWTILAFLLTSFLFHICLHKDWLISVFGGLTSTIIYFKIYQFVLKKIRKMLYFGRSRPCFPRGYNFTLFYHPEYHKFWQ
ncbi:hypothetical protein NQ317_008357 [Molorchus minor]|uniref:Uncharacterized protein n=1 Tax=Molorchus minor TaxID=1323400 RepID=A0ABQ9K729_9CUCU|nr:hypothetical protein NQ317_008357 [Molorchus minor]